MQTRTIPGKFILAAVTALVLLALGLAACGGSSPAATTTPGGAITTTPGGQNVTVDLVAKNIAFDKSTITVPVGAQVTINFDNQDSGIPHNFSVYTDSSAKTVIYQGAIVTGPKQTTYTFTAPATPGNYFFRCDVHPTKMTGTFVVQ
jgi:plastocyanin